MVNKPFVFALLCLTAPIPIRADVGDYESARAALERGDVLPLAAILEKVERDTGARVIEVDFELEDGRYLYEFDMLTGDGRMIEAIVDAATGTLLSVGEEEDD
ncbi:PepSY domain-containing protein [uncultured Amaricoccus sp.]|uniref:PepSY domain-containing protein n=1 Tax=uncultured Amaricoccus sp. TaxID=339341 RepID=UPI002625204F|nr:PepSY domain-containing protein [uncultured Amaricoccus sp.]